MTKRSPVNWNFGIGPFRFNQPASLVGIVTFGFLVMCCFCGLCGLGSLSR